MTKKTDPHILSFTTFIKQYNTKKEIGIEIVIMWKASAGLPMQNAAAEPEADDDWETDPDFVNDVTEEEQRWGSKTIEGSGRTAGAIELVFLSYFVFICFLLINFF